ncbi:MAG: tetratricopeptide repeat protein, partial [Ostreibacterium sp.]
RHYQQDGVMRWQFFKDDNHGAITEGLFDGKVVDSFVLNNNQKTASAYCFAMQQVLLKQYDTNPDTLANLAQCYLAVGYSQLSADAINRGLKARPEHGDLNYLKAELDFIQNKYLSPDSLDHLLVAIKSNPNNFKVLRLLAFNSLNQGDYQQAQFFFKALRKLAVGNTALLAELDQIDAKISKQIATKPLATSPMARQQTTSAIVPSQQSARDKTVQQSSKILRATVKITPQLAKSLSGQAILFVVVKSSDGQLINATKQVIDDVHQPIAIVVSDGQAGMMQRQAMNNFDRVNVLARISINGSPMATSGDLTSDSVAVNLDSVMPITLLIDQKVP